MNTAEEIINKINEKKITPISLLTIKLKYFLTWFFLILTVLLLAWIISILIYHLADNSWDINKDLLNVVPVLFFILAGILLLLSIFEFKNTERGYKFSNIGVIVGAIFIAGSFGAFLYFIGIGENSDRIFVENIKPYRDYIYGKAKRFSVPELGILVGQIILIDPNGVLMMLDLNQNTWNIFLDNDSQFLPQDILLGKYVKVFGEIIDEQMFKAIEIKELTSTQILNLIKLR